MMNVTGARHLAIALNEFIQTREAIASHRLVGDAFIKQLRDRDAADRALRKAFKGVTGLTLVYRRGGYTVRES